MNFWPGILNALKMILRFDPEMLRICFISVKVSLISTTLATLIGVPLGLLIGSKNFYGRGLLRLILNSLLAVPTVVIGLFIYYLLSRQGA
ncbi:MAG: ABC transporter permease, partial [Planctomycetota bacterium]